MIRVLLSLATLLACFGYAVMRGWILVPQATCVAIGLAAYTALMAEAYSDRH